ncbi:aspartate kinase [Algoriphagus kandeliae]|uniref:Aspartokinase n=1 Tax=Algoriphagus kandeliae TaxID=2562278 RepID=A0A4Y9QUM1_9BACT|nr:aspartate kinase [Algoriphagus kandeliae]TFV96199.1 aspartate kinase [Algoriphagus kandeliae]
MTKTIIFKFGGASVKDADSIKNLAEILRNRLRNRMVLVISAMGKTTNALESLIRQRMENLEYSKECTIIKNFHLEICQKLFPEDHSIFPRIDNLFTQLENQFHAPINQSNYDESYDRIVSFGELISTRIISEYLCSQGLLVVWQDARELIRTSSDFRFALVDWEKTRKQSQRILNPILDQFPVITQGFIGSDGKGRSTTLGREGSDFTAAILASSLNANSVTIWKDVPGVLNADPKIFSQTQKFDELGYKEAAEMTYFGASVIHPKTIKPLANKGIPLFVKSFLNPEASGTKIHGQAPNQEIPAFILKKNQILITFKVTDFTFIGEEHIHQIYDQLKNLKLRVNMLQLSAISVSVVIDDELFKLDRLLKYLKNDFEIRFNSGLELLTILNHKKVDFEPFLDGYDLLLEQTTRNTFQAVRRKIVEQEKV